ncbi:MAG: branched-chain amino acid ABC transporter substrate-binding protein [Chloroflexota bacterium]|nr:branched-chain amino acid ABC transporter substrate-binding protein [Chloroflexota bacterium]
MKRLFLVFTLFGLLVTFGAPALADGHCMDELGCVEIGPDEPIVIGAMLSVSGATSFYGEDSRGGVELAILGRDNMLLGRDIEFVVEDSLCSAEGGQAAAQRMAADETIVGIIGTTCSGAAQGALPIISEAGMLMISPSNTSPSLTNDDRDAGGTYLPGYFRTAHNDLFQGALGARFAVQELRVGSLATIHDGDPYTEGLAVVMANTFGGLNGDVVFQGAVSKGDTDMSAILTEIAASGPDIVYFPVFVPESEFIASQLVNTPGLEEALMMTADGSFSATFAQNTGDAAVGIYMTGPHVSGDAYDAFLGMWREEIDEAGPPSGFHAHAYDGANLLMDAVEAVAEEMDDGTLVIGRQALRDALSSVEAYDGLTGSLTCQDASPYAGDCATGDALAVFSITEAEVAEGNWPPPIVWTPSMASGG